MTLLRLPAAALLVGLAACESVPARPSWAADVAPILRANCIRCHSNPTLFGAPDGFRLDRLAISETDDHRYVLGAREVAGNLAARVADRSMPPDFPLSDRQIEILERWAADPDLTPITDNAAPTMRLSLGEADTDGFLAVAYDLHDPDREVVTGRLEARGPETIVLTRELLSGRGELRWDVAAAPVGRYALVAVVDDGSGEVELALGRHQVEHPGGAAPTVSIALHTDPDPPDDDPDTDDDNPTVDTSHLPLVTAADSRRTVALEASGDAVGLPTLVALRGGVEVPLALADLTSPRLGLPAGDGWRLVATVESGGFARTATSLPFAIGEGTSELRFADVSEIFATYCVGCHFEKDDPNQGALDFNFGKYADDDELGTAGVWTARGRIYRRAVRQRTMPPVSAELLFDQPAMPEAARATLREWLEAGAPE